jgi:hypothetical protein
MYSTKPHLSVSYVLGRTDSLQFNYGKGSMEWTNEDRTAGLNQMMFFKFPQLKKVIVILEIAAELMRWLTYG